MITIVSPSGVAYRVVFKDTVWLWSGEIPVVTSHIKYNHSYGARDIRFKVDIIPTHLNLHETEAILLEKCVGEEKWHVINRASAQQGPLDPYNKTVGRKHALSRVLREKYPKKGHFLSRLARTEIWTKFSELMDGFC